VSPLLDQRGGVDVRVVDEKSAPLEGIVVTLQDAASRAAMVDVPTGITRNDGWCAFSDVAVGSTLVMTEGGHGARSRVDAGERAQVVIRLSGRDALDTILVRGTVVDTDGAPFEDAQILIASVPRLPQSPPCEPREVARTDSAGRFTVPRVATGAFVAACAPGMVPTRWIEASARGNRRGDHREMELRLVLRDGGGGVRGRVVDVAGRAVPDAALLVGGDTRSLLERETDDATGASALPRLSLLARTDRDGRFELDGIHPGTESVTARAAGFAPWSGAVAVREGETSECEITLSPGARVEGFVRDASGEPVADAEIAIGPPLRFTSTRARAHADGSFRLDGLTPGPAAVVVTSERGGACAAKLELVAGETLRWDATLRAGGAIRGMVRTTSGTPLSRWFVSARVATGSSDLEALSGMEKLASAWTDEKGDFTLEHLTSAGYDLELFDERNDPVPAAARRNVAPDSSRLEIVVPDEALASATLVGVILAADGRVPAGIELFIGSSDVRTGSRGYSVDPATGRFEVGPLPPGNYFLVARAPGLPDCERTGLRLDAGRRTEAGEVRFTQAAALVLSFGGDGVELSGGEVTVHAAGGFRKTATIVGRAATIEGLPPGACHVAVAGPGFAAQQFRLDVPAGGRIERSVALAAGVALTLRICSPAHAIPANIFPSAHVVDAGTRDRLISTNLSDLAQSPFDWKIRLAPGRYTALVYADSQEATAVDFSVGAGDPSDRVVEVHPR
jgi:protocatechuate 3,4-dioxygenase beta subunit